ncbi:MAG: hypothetical protein WKG07_30445 [Hymenobacter sp.]
MQSVLFALERLGVANAVLTADPAVIRQADRVLFPGEGEASFRHAGATRRRPR